MTEVAPPRLGGQAGVAALGHLYLVATPRPEMTEADFLARIAAALDGGVDTLQLRCKADGDPRYAEARPYIALAEKVRELAHAHHIPFFVNDRPDVALAAGADGVHLGQNDLPVAWARQLGPSLMLGRSTHAPEQAAAALAEAPAYFACGPVHATPTKPGRAAVGLDYIRAVAAMKPACPWYAIGGIDHQTIHAALDAGARRVAVVRAVLDAPDPAAAAAELQAALQQASLTVTPTFTLNGDPAPLSAGLTLLALLHELDVDPARVAAAVNDDFYPAGSLPDRPLSPGDVVDVVQMMVGG
ncbi:thiamine phosphate synthase [Deinococcus sp. Marseille-Q6407]|uniref:thiamine phosphate synthase n=1 Tax=Deinococcus sp. Marseille-Q6407 TaxID=2969223 RepID=UPI0021BEF4F1|nr:thiamine phosphate synthase [Deinococcus sp. Marseille-Q6407]